LQMRLNEDGHFRCDKCTERDKSFKNKFDKR
jgi:hypothetical protein